MIFKNLFVVTILTLYAYADIDISQYRVMTPQKLSALLQNIVSNEELPRKISPEVTVTSSTLDKKEREFHIVMRIEPNVLDSELLSFYGAYKDNAITNACSNNFIRYIFTRGYSQKYRVERNGEGLDSFYITDAICESVDLRNSLSVEFLNLKNSIDKAVESKTLDVNSDEYADKMAELESQSLTIDSIACFNTALHVNIATQDIKQIANSITDKNINVINCKSQSPLFLTLFHKNSEKVALLLIQNGADIDLDLRLGERVIHQAIKLNRGGTHTKYIKMLVAMGASLHVKDTDGNTPLIIAIKSSQNTLASYLIEKMSSVDDVNSFGKSALFYALQYEDEKLVKELLKKGASTSIVSNDSETIYDVASHKMKKLLKTKKVKNSETYYVNAYAFAKYRPTAQYLKRIEDLGYSYKYVKDGKLTKLYIGEFSSKKSAKEALKIIKESIEKSAYIVKE